MDIICTILFYIIITLCGVFYVTPIFAWWCSALKMYKLKKEMKKGGLSSIDLSRFIK